MKILQTFILTVCVLISATAVAGNSTETQNRDVKGFSAIKVSSGIDLYLRMGNRETVEVVASNSVADKIITEVKNGTLHIYMKKNKWLNWGGNGPREVHVTVSQLEELHASAGADVKTQNTLDGQQLEVSTSSGSDVKLDLHYKNCSINASSGSDAELYGKVKYLNAEASSGSDIDAKDLDAQFCKVHASSGSDISISVSDELEAHASSGADIIYYGNPKMRDIDESSGGDVRSR